MQYHNYTTTPMAQFASSLHLGIVHCLNHAVRNPADIIIRGVQGRSSDSFQQSNTFPPNATVAFVGCYKELTAAGTVAGLHGIPF